MSIYFWEGLPLFVNGKLAMHEDCCCDDDCIKCLRPSAIPSGTPPSYSAVYHEDSIFYDFGGDWWQREITTDTATGLGLTAGYTETSIAVSGSIQSQYGVTSGEIDETGDPPHDPPWPEIDDPEYDEWDVINPVTDRRWLWWPDTINCSPENVATWDASTNTPALEDGTLDGPSLMCVTKAGTQNLGSGDIEFFEGDHIVYLQFPDDIPLESPPARHHTWARVPADQVTVPEAIWNVTSTGSYLGQVMSRFKAGPVTVTYTVTARNMTYYGFNRWGKLGHGTLEYEYSGFFGDCYDDEWEFVLCSSPDAYWREGTVYEGFYKRQSTRTFTLLSDEYTASIDYYAREYYEEGVIGQPPSAPYELFIDRGFSTGSANWSFNPE